MIKRSIYIFMVLMTGCASIGPKILTSDRYNYNIAMEYTARQELLLNMVRMRYNETPMVLSVGNISASAKLDRGAGIQGNYLFPPIPKLGAQNGHGGLGGGGTINYTDNPIISYTPLQSKDYTTQFLSALTMSDLALLLQSSWSLPRIFRVTLQSAGNTYNAPSAARSTSSHLPEYQNFIDFTYVLRRLQIANLLDFTFEKNGKADELVVSLTNKDIRLTPKEKRILQTAGADFYQGKMIFSTVPGPHRVYVVPRSLLGILNYLSKGVEIPPEDAKSKVIDQTYSRDGRLFDWQKVVRGMMKIYYSNELPKDISVAIPYRGRWYYIKDSDTDSKQTLIMLENLMGLIETMPPGSAASVGLTRNV